MAQRTLAWTVLLLLAGPTLAAGPGASPEPEGEDLLECGELSPFDNDCEDSGERFHGTAHGRVTTLGYVGHLRVELRGDDGYWLWNCFTLAVPPPEGAPREYPLGRCAGPTRTGEGLERGERVTLKCKASPTWEPGIPREAGVGPGPWGPWGCHVDLPG